MPRGDKTGPDGFGPMTGRAAGYCAGYPVPGFMNPNRGCGRGLARRRGRGRGRGFGRDWNVPIYQPVMQPPTPDQELATLENYQKQLETEKADLNQEAEAIKTRIDELKKLKK